MAVALLLFFCKRRRNRRKGPANDTNGVEDKVQSQGPPVFLFQPPHSTYATTQHFSAVTWSSSPSPFASTYHLQPSSEAPSQSGIYPVTHGHLNSQSSAASMALRRSNITPATSDRDTSCLSYATDSTAIGAPNALKPLDSAVDQPGKLVVPNHGWEDNSLPTVNEHRRVALRVRNGTTTLAAIEDQSAPPAYNTLGETPPPVPEKSAVILRYPGSSNTAAATLTAPSGSAGHGDGGMRRAKSVV